MKQSVAVTHWIRSKLIHLLVASGGQALVEYALILALLSLAATVTLTPLGEAIQDVFVGISQALTGDSDEQEESPPPDEAKPGNPDPGPPNAPKPGNPDPGPPNAPKPGNPNPGPKNELAAGPSTRV